MGVYICRFNDMVRIIQSDKIKKSTKIYFDVDNGFQFMEAVMNICNALNGKIIAGTSLWLPICGFKSHYRLYNNTKLC